MDLLFVLDWVSKQCEEGKGREGREEKAFRAHFVCMAGILCGVLSTIFIFTLDFTAFAVMYTFGNIAAIGSSLFLMGPLRQLQSMCQTVRLLTTIAYFTFMGLTLFSAFYLQSGGLTLLFCLLQFCALIWYTLSYIPYARELCCKCFKSVTGVDEA